VDIVVLYHHLRDLKKRLVLFDFDGTVTTRDTLLEFIRFYRGDVKFVIGFGIAAPIIVLSKLKIVPNWKAKEFVLTWFFKGTTLEEFNRKGQEFASQVTPTLLRPKGLAQLKEYLQDSRVIFVSASAENWVKPWCDSVGVECLATKLEVVNGKLTGKIAGKNCYGPEKVNRLLAHINPKEYEEIIVYGDSSGDRELLTLGHHQYYKPFRN
jgi:HAD superfamily hydrolase (TIGR01490 family)